MSNTVKNTSILLLVLANTGCDQMTKHAARRHIGYFETIDVIGKHLVLTKIENSGAFLSAGDSMGDSVKFVFLSFVPLIALLYGIYYLLTHENLPRLLVTGICFVIGGGLGNLYDRFRYGSVTDFVHIDFYPVKTGIFNLADVSIMVGMILIIINLYFKRIRVISTEDEQAETQ